MRVCVCVGNISSPDILVTTHVATPLNNEEVTGRKTIVLLDNTDHKGSTPSNNIHHPEVYNHEHTHHSTHTVHYTPHTPAHTHQSSTLIHSLYVEDVLYGVFPVWGALQAKRRQLHTLYIKESLVDERQQEESAHKTK